MSNNYLCPVESEDEEEIRSLYWNVRQGDIVIDVGCFMGLYTIPALRAGAIVYAIDPNHSCTDIIRSRAGDTDKLTIVNAALSEEGGYPSELRKELEKSPWNTMFAPPDVLSIQEMYRDCIPTTQYITLDALVECYDIPKIDLLKIDVEGAELSVLQGGVGSLNKFRPRIIVEDHTEVYPFVAEMGSRQKCLDLLIDVGYDVKLVPYRDGITSDRAFLICQ